MRAWMAVLCLLFAAPLAAQESICARVKIEIKQELTLERQAFDANMKIDNALDGMSLEDLSVNVSFSDENGVSILASSDPNNTQAAFFIRIDSMSGIDNVDGAGIVQPASTADIHWLIIPAPGSGGLLPSGKLYYVGATLSYTVGGKPETTEVSPDYIYVKPMPLLTLDYFLPEEVFADDAFTSAIEPPVPFTLGTRVKNNGGGVASKVKIESAQPKIVENEQGLLINFRIIGSNVNEQPVTPDLLIDFGDIPSNESAMGRWVMYTTLSGKFVEFTADFSHADELGGQLTSLIEDVRTHVLVQDVLVDLPGRDSVRDFLARDGVLRVYESNGIDTEVTDQSGGSTLTRTGQASTQTFYTLDGPPTAGFMYVKLPDPHAGTREVTGARRSDGKEVTLFNNVWLSKERRQDRGWNYFVNLFDVNTTGDYMLTFGVPVFGPRPPVMQFIPDRTTIEGRQISFIVEASDPDGTTPVLTAGPLPAGALYADQGNGVAIFDWTPVAGQAGVYPIAFVASDGALQASQIARITVLPLNDSDNDGMDDDWEREHFGDLDGDGSADSDGDGIPDYEEYLQGTDPLGLDGSIAPLIVSPWFGSNVDTATPELQVINARHPRPNVEHTYEFQVFADKAMTIPLAAASEVNEQASSTAWLVDQALPENQIVYWRVRAHDGTLYTRWVYGHFRVNTVNGPPGSFAASWPADGVQVALAPVLEVTNAVDPDGDAVSYRFQVYADQGLTSLIATSALMPQGALGVTSWQDMPTPLADGTYYWRAVATDENGLDHESPVMAFTVNALATTPSMPTIVAPTPGEQIPATAVTLEVSDGIDGNGNALSYRFELDTAMTFDGPDKRVSGAITAGQDSTAWSVTGLSEGVQYYWRAKAGDGLSESRWVQGSFVINTLNALPGEVTPVNPGDESWVSTLSPVLSVDKQPGPYGDELRYEYEIYTDRELTSLFAAGGGSGGALPVMAELPDHGWYYWRVRALDGDRVGPWSTTLAFYVNDGEVAEAGDENADGRVDSIDLGVMMSRWSEFGALDLNRDGVIGSEDLYLLIRQWSRGQ
jgi:hypothetical protein